MTISHPPRDAHPPGERACPRPRWPRRRILACAVALGLWSIRPARAGGVPSDPDAFTAYVANRIGTVAPGTPVTVTGTLSLDVGNPGLRHSLYLQRLFDACRRNPDAAETLVDSFIGAMTAVARDPEPQPTRETLRVIVRPDFYVKSELETLAGRAAPVAKPLAGNLWLLGASDLPTAIKMLDSRDIARLGVSTDEAIAIAKQNMRPALEEALAQARKARVPGVNLVTGDPYESSLLAFPEIWQPLARASLGDLLVAAPQMSSCSPTRTRPTPSRHCGTPSGPS